MVFGVTMMTFQMTVVMNAFTNTIIDDGRVHPLVKSLPPIVINL